LTTVNDSEGMEGMEGMEGAMPLSESALVLSGPDDSIFDDIFDWIANAIHSVVRTVTGWISSAWTAITSTVTSWISWLWDAITPWFQGVFDRLRAGWEFVTGWVTASIGQVWTWITTSVNSMLTTIGAWFTEQWSSISSLFSTWFTQLRTWWSEMVTNVTGTITALGLQLEASFTWLVGEIVTRVTVPMATWWDQFLEKLFTPAEWIGKLMDGITAWLLEDVPGHSIRWKDILKSIGDWFYYWFGWYAEQWITDPAKMAVHHVETGLGWIGDWFTSVFETFMDAIMGLVRQIGPTNPSTAVNSYSAMAKVGMVALGGLAGMTIAGETLNPISHLGLGHISAMIYDMTNYKLITGVFMGALTVAMLRQPLTYYFNDIFRPYILRIGDFMELMARDAWSHPELLREPTLISSVQELTRGAGTAFESMMIGYYGYPAQYYGLFKELSFAPLRYFPLAGIARVGFWDEAWFTEALSRSGYSPTARAALMDMYREQVLTARQLPVMSQIRRLSREGFATMEEIKAHLDKAAAMETLTESRFFAMELEQEFARKEMAFDIMMRAFSRGITLEGETRKGLAGLGVPGTMLDLHFMREKLGLLRRISIPTEPAAPAMIGVEE